MGEIVEFASNGGTASGYLATPDGGGGIPVVVIQEWWGLVPHIKDVAEKQNRTHDVVIGTAHLDLVGLFQGLKKVGFPADGSISLEYESNPANPIDDVTQCLAAAKEAIKKAAG